MEYINVPTLYKQFCKNIKKKPYQLLGLMKSLTLSNKLYENFYNSSTDLYLTKTFKEPNETQYPKLKSHNYLSLQKQLKTFSHQKQKKLVLKLKNKPPNSAKINKKPVISTEKINNKNVNFFICENDYGQRHYKKYFRNDFSTVNFYNLKKLNCCKTKTNFHNKGKLKTVKSEERFSLKINKDEQKENIEIKQDMFLLLDSIFPLKKNYKDLKYNETEIFGFKNDYYNYLKDELTDFINKEKELNQNSFLYKLYDTSYGKVDLYLKSAKIEIIEKINNSKQIIKTIDIPFQFMSLLYLSHPEQTEHIIFNILKYEKIFGSKEKNLEIFKKILDITTFINDSIKLNSTPKNYERYFAVVGYLEQIQGFSDAIRYNCLIADFEKNINKVIVENIGDNMTKKNKKLFNSNITSYNLNLVSNNNNKYIVKLSMPEIVLIFKDYQTQLNHYINKELFIFIYQNNYMDWDFYLLHYLFSLKNFRKFVGSALSIRYNKKIIHNSFLLSPSSLKTKIHSNKINTFNKSHRVLSNKNIKEINKNIVQKNDITKNKKYILSSSFVKSNIYTENDCEFNFLYDCNESYNLYKFKSYILYVYRININHPIVYEFNFNYQQSRVLYYKSMFEDLETFLKRLITVTKDHINLEYSYFDSFIKMTNKEIFLYFKDLAEHSNEDSVKEEQLQINFNSIIYKIIFPHFDCVTLSKNLEDKIIETHVDINMEYLDELI